MSMNDPLPKVVVILPYRMGRILLQLRDAKPGIVFADQWGFFGGRIEADELPIKAAIREIAEEISYQAECMVELNHACVPAPLIQAQIITFAMPLKCTIDKLVLREGTDFGLFDEHQISNAKLYSPRTHREHKVISVNYMLQHIECLKRQVADFMR